MAVFNNDIEDLINGLYRPSIFYIPETFFSNISDEIKQGLIDYRVTNELAVLKQTGEIAYVENCIPVLELLNKANNLENNLFQLHRFRDNLKKDSFLFILDSYSKNVTACEFVYGWLFNNLGVAIEKVKEDHKNLFDLQHTLAKQHLEKLEQFFSIENTIGAEKIEDVIKSSYSIFTDKKFNEVIADPAKGKTNLKRKNKQSLLTESEADRFLLEKVFNVKFPNVIK